jgi:hypothetical protein
VRWERRIGRVGRKRRLGLAAIAAAVAVFARVLVVLAIGVFVFGAMRFMAAMLVTFGLVVTELVIIVVVASVVPQRIRNGT